jgi:ferritin-like metal-binding protein YciE
MISKSRQHDGIRRKVNNADRLGKASTANNFVNNIIAVSGLNLALAYENSSVDRLEQRISECFVPQLKNKLKQHLEQTKKQQELLRERIQVLGGQPIQEKGKLPIPEPPQSIKKMIEMKGTEREREIWESINDLIIERSEAIMYRAGIQALELLESDRKTIKTLKIILKQEKAFGAWLEKNNPKIAKKLMKRQMRNKRKRDDSDIVSEASDIEQSGDKNQNQNKNENRETRTQEATATTTAPPT